MFQWVCRPLYNETGLLTFLVCICLIFRRNLCKKRWLGDWGPTLCLSFCVRAALRSSPPSGDQTPATAFVQCSCQEHSVTKLSLPTANTSFRIHKLGCHFVPYPSSNVIVPFCLGTGALESSPWSTSFSLPWMLQFVVRSRCGQVA